MAFFEPISASGRAQAFVFFDVSGSTIANSFQGTEVIRKMADAMFDEMKLQQVNTFKVAFFGSPNAVMKDGYVLDFSTYTTVSPVSIFIQEAMQHTNRYNLTCPHYAFQGVISEYKKGTRLLVDWMNPKEDVRRMVFIVGDGELFDGTTNKTTVKAQFKKSMDEFMLLFPIHSFLILTVDVSSKSMVENAVGSDMYEACGNTKRISKFKTITTSQPEGEILFENATVPISHVRFGQQMFSRVREPEFYEWVKTQDPSFIIRNLCSALADYIEKEGMNDAMMECFLNSYKKIIPTEYADILHAQTHRIMHGTAALSTEFRKSLTEKFASAEESLLKDAQKAMGTASSVFMTTVHYGKIYKANARDVKFPFQKYERGSIRVDGLHYPVFPLARTPGDMNEQCTRQFLRAVMSKYGYEARDEKTKWAVLCEMLTVVYTPDMDEEVKTSWRLLGNTMLHKKVAGKDITELDYFRQGNTLSSTLKSGLNTVAAPFGLTGDEAWAGICKQMGIVSNDDILAINQKVKDFESHKLSRVELVELEELEWKCPVTFESTESGGWTFPDHAWRGTPCESRWVISTSAVDGMNVDGRVKCLVCRTCLSRDAMTWKVKAPPPQKNRCVAIQMVGVPGSGKTTAVREIMNHVHDWTPHIISLDEECAKLTSTGVISRDAVGMAVSNITSEIGHIRRLPGKHVILVDTYGDYKEPNVFGHVMEILRVECNVGEDWNAYFGGSLYEALRDPSEFQQKINLHRKKSHALWKDKYKLKPPYTSVDAAREYLRPFHEKWIRTLDMSAVDTFLK